MIIVTGFEPFKNFKKNPSWLVAKVLEGEDRENILSIKIPVSYQKVRNLTGEILQKYRPDAILSLGLADGRAQISVEKIAVNIMDSSSPDNEGFAPRRKKIFEDGSEVIVSTAPVFKIVDALRNQGIPAYVSYHAGTYVCNALFYSFLYHARKMSLNIPIGFIHLPSSEDMVLKRDNRPYVESETMKKAIKIAVEIIHLSSP